VNDAPRRPDDPRLASLRALARWLDDAIQIPGTKLRIGLDPLLGLIPGVGDAAGALLSAYLVLAAARLGAPAGVLGRMAVHLAVDAFVGAVPFFGDLFDFGWKANTRNLRLLEAWLADPGPTRRASGLVVALLLVGTLAVMAATAWATWRIVAWAFATVAGG
jgi:hypothetical protein